MKRTVIAAFAILVVLLLASCTTTEFVPEAMSHESEPFPPMPLPQPESVPEPEPIEEPQETWTVGEPGPHGGLVFRHENTFLEAGDPIYETQSYDEAVILCQQLSDLEGISVRLPTLKELQSYYEQLVLTEISDVDWTYYWSCEESDDGSVKILNFDTGFEGQFYKDMDFVSIIPVIEL